MSNQTPTITTYLYKIVPSAKQALPALNGTTEVDSVLTFNTNIPFGMTMVIRRVQTKWFRTTMDDAHTSVTLLIAQLTEAIKATAPSATDPLALWSDINVHELSVGGGTTLTKYHEPGWKIYDYLPSHPGVPTNAQQLALILSGNNIDATHTDVSVWNNITEIYYELRQLTQELKDYLANRISLQRTS